MKTLLLTLLFTTLAFAGMTGTKEDSIRMVELEKKVENLQAKVTERDALYENHLKDIQAERNSFVSFIESNINCFKWILSIATAFVLGLLGFFGWKHGKTMKEYKSELKEDAERELRKARDKAILEISSMIKKDPMVVKSVMDERLKDAELKKKMSICLLYSDEQEKNKVELQLLKFGIENVTEQSFEKVGELSNDKIEKVKENILFIIDSSKDEEKSDKKNTQLCFHVGDNKSILNGRNVFYKGSGTFPNSSEYTSNFAKTNVTIYQNLLDLMRYIDFKQPYIN
jgi:hypothetical protein